MVPSFSLAHLTITRFVSIKLFTHLHAHILPQFLDPLLLSLEVYRETHRKVQFLTAAKSMERQWIGFFARLMDSSEFELAVHSR